MSELGIRVADSEVGAIGADVPIGVSAAIVIEGRNDMTTAQKLGVIWEVRDPDGEVQHSYDAWATFSTPAGQVHKFVSDTRFSLDKPGNWTIDVKLLMNPDAPVVVAGYGGLLCVVSEEFAGSIVTKDLDYDGQRVPFPPES